MIVDGVYSDSLVLRRNAGEGDNGGAIEVTGTVAGPAGVSTTEFPDGTVWEVDHARPAQLVHVTLPDAALGGELIVELFGSRRAEQIRRWAASADGSTRARRIGTRQQPGDREFRGSLPPRRGPWAEDVGDLIVAADVAADPVEPNLVRVAAAAEFLLGLDRRTVAMLAPIVAAITGILDRLSATVASDELQELVTADPAAASRLARLLAEAGGATPSGGPRQLGHLLEAVLQEDNTTSAVAYDMAWDAGPAREAAGTWSLLPRAVGEPERAPAPESHRTVELAADGLLVVTVARSDDDRWVRVLRRDGLVVLGAAPLRRHELLDRAEVVIPPDLTVADIDVQVIRGEQLTRPLTGAALVREAIRVGRLAARAARGGHVSHAAEEWRRCGALWEEAGDPARAALAEAYASDLISSPWSSYPGMGSVADAVALALTPGSSPDQDSTEGW